MKYSRFFAVVFSSLLLTLSALGQSASMTPQDLKVLEGVEWVGTLTYLDYGTGKPVNIKSNLKLTPDKGRTWIADYAYPDEPKANSKSTLTLSDDGKLFNDQKLIAIGSKGDLLKIITTKDGTDNDKKAVFRYTYYIAPKRFTIRQEVKVEGADAFFKRSEYNWTPKPRAQ